MRALKLGFQMPRELRDRRKVEDLCQINLTRIFVVDLLVDFNELQRTRPKLEQIIVDPNALAFKGGVADELELLLDFGARARSVAALRLAQFRKLGKLGIKFSINGIAKGSGMIAPDMATMLAYVFTDAPIAPCGACRQVIMELGGPELPIRLGNLHGDTRDTTAREQLPDAFYL